MNKNITSHFKNGITKLKQGQNSLMMLLIVALCTITVTLVFVLFSKTSKSSSVTKEPSYKAQMTSGQSRIDPKEIWVEKFTNDQAENIKRIAQLEKTVEDFLKAEKASEQSDKTIQSTDIINDLRDDIKESMQSENGDPGDPFLQKSQQKNLTPLTSPQDISQETVKTRPHTKGIKKLSLNLPRNKSNKSLKTFDNTIPSGAFAQAILLGGVDASTSIQASSDPRPILLRVIDPGTLPRRFHSDLMGCHVLAASYGDISSERVFMRLEKLTCTERKTGEIVEMNVSGYVAGEDGRAGLRGSVVDRAGESMRHAAIGGFLGSVGNFFSQPNNPVTYSLNSGISQTNPLSNGQLLTHGLSKGAGSALDKYAEFYIKRAEQMQPVIQIQAGRIADIVFTQGTPFEDSAARSVLVQTNDQNRLAQLNQSHFESKNDVSTDFQNQATSINSINAGE